MSIIVFVIICSIYCSSYKRNYSNVSREWIVSYPNFIQDILRLAVINYTGWPNKNGTVDFWGLCSDQHLSFYTLLDRTSFPHYNNTKIIKFGWKLFILWEVSYGLSFSGFAISLSLIVPQNSGNRANPENDIPSDITHKIKSSQPNLMILVLL